MKWVALSMAAAVSIGGMASVSSAAIVDPGLSGNVRTDAWDFSQVPLTSGGIYSSADSWPSPIVSNVVGVDAEFNKVSGYGYIATDSAHGGAVYVGSFTDGVNLHGGTFAVSEAQALAGLQTVVFQLEILEAHGIDFESHALPTLSYNGGTQGLLVNLSSHTKEDTGNTFENPQTHELEPVLINTWTLQWDLRGISDPINSFDIDWSTVMHSRMYTARLDQSDVYTAVPEPAMLGLLSLGGFVLLRRKHR